MIKKDWYFIVPASAVFVSSLTVALWDFFVLQGAAVRVSFLNVLGLVLFLVGVCIRTIAKRTLAKNYSYVLGTNKPKELVKHGVYRFVRHPIYLALILYGLGMPLVFTSIIGLIISFGFVPCVLYRIRLEEELLIKEFGEEYTEYKKQTKKLIPYIY